MFHSLRATRTLAFFGACVMFTLWSEHAWAAPPCEDHPVQSVDNDFDGDCNADMLWRNADNGSAVIWLMDGTTRVTSGSIGKIDLVWKIVRVEDYNGDGKADIAFRNTDTGSTVIWLMDGLDVIDISWSPPRPSSG